MAATLNHAERRHIPDRRSNGGARSVHTVKRMTAVDWIPMLLLIIGGINWGLVGLMDLDVVAMLFGEGSTISRVIYGLVGLSALYSIYLSSRMSSKRV
ncbi:MAG TPA: DUF378 domain-containing protein [Noviherbaspirillum sp.]|uniref:DUF378 domain-containing protein n=1 Tax=Noviherbaspirillum sp. TaxID=1926288 RepID=UPI002F948660